jgi:tagatose-6-phosphate ketose/aldose isomerase
MITELVDAHAGGGVEHTVREVAQQPTLWREVARTAAARHAETQAFLRPLLDRPDLRIVLTGAGTSAFAGEVLAPALTRELRRRVDAVATTDIVSNPRECFAEDRPTLLVSFARSGDSPESVAATELADALLPDCYHLIVTCNSEGRLHRYHAQAERSLVLLMPEQANDQGFAMTSSFTCMVLGTLLTLSPGDRDEALVERLAAAGERVLADLDEPARAVAAAGYERVVYLGSGPLKGLARESSLKLLELTAGRVGAWFDSPLGFRHGPKSLVDLRTLAVVYLSSDPYTRAYDLDLVAELRASMAPGSVVTIAADADGLEDSSATWLVEGLAGVADAALALPFVMCAQLIGVHASVALGLTPDNPFPSGEVNRVVQGVTIHPLRP